MLWAFYRLAGQSPSRHLTWRTAAVIHVLLTAFSAVASFSPDGPGLAFLGHVLLITAIVEGALLIGWRLTQIPKSQALEFLLVSPVQPRNVFYGEALVGLTLFFFVNLTSVPVFLVLYCLGMLEGPDLAVFTLMPLTWGMLTGLGITSWAYEPTWWRRILEAVMGMGFLVYLLLGVLAAEKLGLWLTWLPLSVTEWLSAAFIGFHKNNPFGLLQDWCAGPQPRRIWSKLLLLQTGATLVLLLFLLRAGLLLKSHFQERHYRTRADESGRKRPEIGDRPLSWWAVKRVLEYAGRGNLYLAGGFVSLYAAFIVYQDQWPAWLGRRVFDVVEQALAGVPGLTTGLAVLAAVPAAFQYGLWDNSLQDRARRLELLLLSQLDANDYVQAALAAAWRRGYGYLVVALVLLGAAGGSGRFSWEGLAGATAAIISLWTLYFAIGYWAFAKGLQANGLGSVLTLGLPLLVFVGQTRGYAEWTPLIPPGAVYTAIAQGLTPVWFLGIVLHLTAASVILAYTNRHCETFLRRWYDRHGGRKAAE